MITQGDLDHHKGWAQCTACGQTFSTDGNFAKHRRAYACVHPASLGLVRAKGGVWRREAPDFSTPSVKRAVSDAA